VAKALSTELRDLAAAIQTKATELAELVGAAARASGIEHISNMQKDCVRQYVEWMPKRLQSHAASIQATAQAKAAAAAKES
jgi:hypothetical protein